MTLHELQEKTLKSQCILCNESAENLRPAVITITRSGLPNMEICGMVCEDEHPYRPYNTTSLVSDIRRNAKLAIKRNKKGEAFFIEA